MQWGCGGEAKPAAEIEGALPILHIGDKWVSRMVVEGIEFTETREVTGEDHVDGKDFYVVELSFEPQLPGLIGVITEKVDKSMLLVTRAQASGEQMGISFVTTTNTTYETTGDPRWPRRVGNEREVVETEMTTTSAMGETTSESTTRVYTYKVETLEEITVPAGTFECFKTVEYDEDGTATVTAWRSHSTKHYRVKAVDHETGDSIELVSYSLR